MYSDNGLPERQWPAVDYQANALAQSGIYVKSNPPARTFRNRESRAVKARREVMNQTLHVYCQDLFVKASGNTNFVHAEPEVIHLAICELCRKYGVIQIPSFDHVVQWVESIMPGNSYSQVLSFKEFMVALKTLCPQVFGDSALGGVPSHLPALTKKQTNNHSKNLAYGLANRKYNATALVDDDYVPRGDRSLTDSMILIADSEHLCEAMKKDARASRKNEKKASSYADSLEKTKINEVLHVGPDAANAVRIKRAAVTQQKARRKFTNGLCVSLGCNLTMVQRHMDMEANSRMKINQQKAINSTVSARRAKTTGLLKFNESAREAERSQRTSGRKAMIKSLKQKTHSKLEAIEAISNEVRNSREILKWSKNTSAYIPKDEVLMERKANATSLREFRAAVEEDAQRQANIRDERLAGLVQEKNHNYHLKSNMVQLGSVQVDGTEVFLKPFTTDDGKFGFDDYTPHQVPSSSPRNQNPTNPHITGSFLDISGQILAEVKPPANMSAAARAYGKTTTPSHSVAFMSATQKGPTASFYETRQHGARAL